MEHAPSCRSRGTRVGWARFIAVAAVAAVAVFSLAAPVFAGQASSGELLFYPCTNCHPVHMIPGTETPTRPLPNGFTGHEIKLQGHDVLGKGEAACMACHDEPTRNPGKLKAIDGSLVDITGNIALVCYRCHSTKYKEWKAGIHGKQKPSCVAAGCHDPHTPQYMFAPGLMPFVGTGFQFSPVGDRQPFAPLAPPAPTPATIVPAWFFGIIALGLMAAGGLAGLLVFGGLKR